MFHRHHDRRGLTLVELLTVIGIIAVVSAIAVPMYATARRDILLNSTAAELVNTLRLAQGRATSSQNAGSTMAATSHGVHLEADYLVTYGGDWATPTYTDTTPLPTETVVCAGVGTNISFERLSGRTGAATTVVVGLDGCGSTKTIAVSAEGRIGVQ